jgi:hypothetical protein
MPPKKDKFQMFESIDEFFESDYPAAIVTFYCMDRQIKGKRYYVDMLCRSSTTRIFNVEKASGSWLKNETDIKGWDKSAPKIGIEICIPGKAYFVYCIKEPDSNVGFRVKSVKEIRKNC